MRVINWDKPLSKEDVAWLEQRLTPELQDKIDANLANVKADPEFTEQNDTDKTELPPDDYDKWKIPELAEEAARRDPPVDLTGISKKPDIIAALRTWDAAHPELLAE